MHFCDRTNYKPTSQYHSKCVHCIRNNSCIVLLLLDAGVVGGCGELCQKLDEKFNNSQIIGVLCDLACDYEGIEEFVKLIQK